MDPFVGRIPTGSANAAVASCDCRLLILLEMPSMTLTSDSLKRSIAALCVGLLTACAAGTDRHGRPIDPLKAMTVDTSPDPGRKPTPQEAEAAIRMADKGDVVFNIVDIRDAFWAEAFTGKPKSGWLVCYDQTRRGLLGVVTSRWGLVIEQDGKDGFKPTLMWDTKLKCRS